jgi:hypothetical protein
LELQAISGNRGQLDDATLYKPLAVFNGEQHRPPDLHRAFGRHDATDKDALLFTIVNNFLNYQVTLKIQKCRFGTNKQGVKLWRQQLAPNAHPRPSS